MHLHHALEGQAVLGLSQHVFCDLRLRDASRLLLGILLPSASYEESLNRGSEEVTKWSHSGARGAFAGARLPCHGPASILRPQTALLRSILFHTAVRHAQVSREP
jgi:hypothetical protein